MTRTARPACCWSTAPTRATWETWQARAGAPPSTSSRPPSLGPSRSRQGLVVPAFDQQPLRALPLADALEGEPALQLRAVEDEYGVPAVDRLGPGDPPAPLVGAAIPDARRRLLLLARVVFY